MNSISIKKDEDRIIGLTDRIDCMLEFKTCDSETQAGLVRHQETLCYDIAGVTCGAKSLLRKNEASYKVDFHSFTIEYSCGTKINVCLLPQTMCLSVEKDGGADGIIVSLPVKYARRFCRGKGTASNRRISCNPLEGSADRSLYVVKPEKMNGAVIYLCFDEDEDKAEKNAAFMEKHNALDSFKEQVQEFAGRTAFETGNPKADSARQWCAVTGMSFVTTENNYTGIWAGLPWFRDNWGRDTFIACPGILLATGEFEKARNVIKGFLQYQNKNPNDKNYGRIPNRYNENEIIYNTADGALWLIREIYEYVCFTGDREFLDQVWENVKLELESDIRLRTGSLGFLIHGDADTWMDARIEGRQAWSSRGNRANDIQVLWYNALLCGSKIASLTGHGDEEKAWSVAAKKVKTDFKEYFWNGTQVADRLDRLNRPDFSVRPNALMLLTVPYKCKPFITKEMAVQITESTIKELLFPWGICSLSQHHENFHPYHDNCELYHKDAAYHNGTIWGWNDGPAIGAMCMTGHKELAWSLAKNLADQIMDKGCAGSMSENLSAYLDEDGSVHCSGTWSQAWSVSEYNRVWWQYFLGLEPDLLNNRIYFTPHFPAEWKNGRAKTVFGTGNKAFTLEICWNEHSFTFTRTGGEQMEIEIACDEDLWDRYSDRHANGPEKRFELKKNAPVEKPRSFFADADCNEPVKETLSFAMPERTKGSGMEPKCLLKEDWLEQVILSDCGISAVSYL